MSQCRDVPVRWLLAVAVATAVNLLASVSFPHETLAYNCGTFSSGHCYATHTWEGSTTGAETLIRLEDIRGGNVVLRNEQWLIDESNYDLAWVEAGYLERAGDSKPKRYFFADKRPGYSLIVSYLANVASSDVNNYVKVKFWKNPNSFSIVIDSPSFDWAGYSNPNDMDPDRIDIGTELGGIGNATSPNTLWVGNKWRATNTTWHYQNRNGDYDTIYNPPYAQWYVRPSDSSSGGAWEAWCC